MLALLLFLPVLWPCWCWWPWLLRHPKVQTPVRQGRQRAQLARDSSISHRHPRAKPEWVRQRVIYLATHQNSCRKIADTFNRWHEHGYVGKSWVAKFVKDNASEIAERRRRMRRRQPALFAVGHTWGLDLTFLVSPHGPTFTMLGIVDHGSRALLCLRALPTKCTFALLGRLFLSIAKFGLPSAIRTDNESMFTSRLWGFTLKMLGIAHRRGPPGQPWRNGRIERLFGTLKPLLRKIRPATTVRLQGMLDEFMAFYNHFRPHQNLGGLTPAEAWHGMRLIDVQRAHAGVCGQWVHALDGMMVAYHARR